jgi:hypothetical protein
VISESGRVDGQAVFATQGDLSLAKSEAIPDVAKDLAKTLISNVVESW